MSTERYQVGSTTIEATERADGTWEVFETSRWGSFRKFQLSAEDYRGYRRTWKAA